MPGKPTKPRTRFTCAQCGKPVFRLPSEIRSERAYCSRICVGAAKSEPDEVRFRRYVEEHDGAACSDWLASHFTNGYGSFTPKNSGRIGAHCFAYRLANGLDSIPDGMYVLHTCDNPGCVRPDHLFLGTPAGNMNDKVAKDRQSRGEQSGRTHLTAQNVKAMRAARLAGATFPELARIFGITKENASYICRRKTWKHID